MKINIHYFALALFLLLGLAAIVLWTVSLFLQVESGRDKAEALYRDNWQLQLSQLQLSQRLWLQQRFNEVRAGLSESKTIESQNEYIRQIYQRYPQISLIQLKAVVNSPSVSADPVYNCLDRPRSRLLSVPELPTVTACVHKLQPMLGVSASLPFADTLTAQQLLILSDYFAFVDDFGQLTAKRFLLQGKGSSIRDYAEEGAVADQRQLVFDFNQEALKLGSLTISLPRVNFAKIWLAQAVWMVPLTLIITLILYYLLFRALIRPLFMITRRMKKVVVTRRPGSGYDNKLLSPGLLLLHRYFMHLSQMTTHDPLTGLNNRLIFEERLQQAMQHGKRSGRKYALVLVDINNFHKVNKQWGNYIGDGLLKQLAKRLISNLRESDSLARLEQDNFAFLLQFVDDNQLGSLVEKVYQSLSQPYQVYGRECSVGISMSVAVYPDHAQTMAELELKANDALLVAHKGDWPVVFAQAPSDQTGSTGFSLIQSLHQALDNNDFMLVYQPVMELSNHSTSYFEALLRWKDPSLHTQPIEQTIALAEKVHLIRPLTQWIIEAACAQLKSMEGTRVKIAINLSMINLHDEDLPERIADTLGQCGVSPRSLMIEITEGQIMQKPDQVIAILSKLSVMGISLSIDDFGTGQASLTYLKKLPVEKLKIDQSFVKDMVNDEDDRSIVEATIKLAHTLGIRVVAEGVESAEIYQLLVRMGCDFVQGYYISRPLDQAQIPDWIMQKDVKPVPSSKN